MSETDLERVGIARGAPQTSRDPQAITNWRIYDPLVLNPVLAAALELFVEKGYHGSTVRDIAHRCGMSVSGIYHYYSNKHEMLKEILESGVTELLCRAEMARADGANSVERFSLMIESLVLYHTHRLKIGFVGASEMRSLDAQVRRAVAAERRKQQRWIDIEVGSAVDQGHFRTLHPLEASRAVVTMCTSIVQWYKPAGPLHPSLLASKYVGFALALMGFQPQ